MRSICFCITTSTRSIPCRRRGISRTIWPRAKMKVCFSNRLDETAALADLILPVDGPLEQWGDYAPHAGRLNLTQPVMGRLYDTRSLGDVFIETGKAVAGQAAFPWPDYLHLLKASWQDRWSTGSLGTSFESWWVSCLQRGGMDLEPPRTEAKPPSTLAYSFDPPPADRARPGSAVRGLPDGSVLRRPGRRPALASGNARPR